ncbi:MAG: hypothetical protein IKP88_18715 [Lachnospiraceae bacterium]|nr:hypothetical protein [Lachnospiraceae bacterium]
MHRIKDFTIIGEDAWHHVYFYTQLEESMDGFSINVYTTKDSYKIHLSPHEDAFIRELENIKIKNIDNKSYELKWGCEDGYHWLLSIKYDDEEIISQGDSVNPKELISLSHILRYKDIYNTFSKDIRFKPMNPEERMLLMSDRRIIDRFRRDLYDEKEYPSNYLVFEGDKKGKYKVGIKSKALR